MGSLIDELSSNRLTVITLDEEEADIVRLSVETLRHQITSILQASKRPGVSIAPDEQQTLKRCAQAIDRLSPKLPTRKRGQSLQHLVRKIEESWRRARRMLSEAKAQSEPVNSL